MVVAAGHDPCLTRTLREAAHSLSGLTTLHSPSLGPLLPEVVRLGSGDLAGDHQAVRLLGGSLAVTNKGDMSPCLASTNQNVS